MKKSGRVGMRIEPHVKELWEDMAKAQGLSLSAWVEYCCATIWAIQANAALDKKRNL